MTFDRERAQAELAMERDTPEGERYAIVLRGVAGLCASNCGFWGPSPHVLDLEAVTEEEGLLDRLRQRWETEPYRKDEPFPGRDCFEVRMTFASGDVWSIVCREMEIPEREIDPKR